MVWDRDEFDFMIESGICPVCCCTLYPVVWTRLTWLGLNCRTCQASYYSDEEIWHAPIDAALAS